MYGGVIKADEKCGGEATICELGSDKDQWDEKVQVNEKNEEETVTEEEAPQQEPAEE